MIPLLAFSLAISPAAGYPRNDLLIEAADLKSQAGVVVVLDVRAAAAHDAGHIPGARRLDAKAWDKAFAKPNQGDWAKRLGDAGIDPDRPIVIYGDNDVRDAARAWWILKYWGAEQVRLLNGGWTAWTAAGGTVSSDAVKPTPAIVRLKPKFAALATKDHLLAGLKDGPPQFVDARSNGEFCGEATTAKRNGKIPGASHLEWKETIDAKTKRFKAPDELAAIIRERKIDLDKPVVTYCQGGGRAAVVAFALELMGGKQVRNYYKSWSEWGNAEDTPIEVLKKK